MLLDRVAGGPLSWGGGGGSGLGGQLNPGPAVAPRREGGPESTPVGAAGGAPTATLHPHVGTVVETTPEVSRVLDGSAIPLCLDTGHLLIGGTDPARLSADVPDRIAHAHLKDVDAALAERVQRAELSYSEAVDQ